MKKKVGKKLAIFTIYFEIIIRQIFCRNSNVLLMKYILEKSSVKLFQVLNSISIKSVRETKKKNNFA